MSAIPIPMQEIEDDTSDDRKWKGIPYALPEDQKQSSAKPIPVAQTSAQGAPTAPAARAIPQAPATPASGSLEDLENVVGTLHPHAAVPIQTGVASLWSKAKNIHNPVLRVLGEIGAGGARVLDTIGTIAAPRIAAAIPGSTLNQRGEQERQQKQETEDAAIGKTKADTSEAQARADAIAHPKPVADKPQTPQQVLAGIVAEDIDSGRATGDDPRYQQAVDAITDSQRDPASVKITPLTGDQATQRNGIWNRILEKNHLPQNPFHEGMTDAEAKEVATQLNNATGKEQAGIRIDTGAAQHSKSEDVKARQEVAKIYSDPLSSAERYNVMTQNLKDAITNHDQQAMLSLLTNHIGMTMGLQKGARITQAILEEAQKSQPWLASMKAKFDKNGYLSGVTLGPEQMKSMVALARGRYKEDVVKARNLAKYAGAEDDGPDRTPSQSTMHYYIDLAKGNAQEAKKLAVDDGWSVR